MNDKRAEQIQTAIRLPKSLLKRIDRLAGIMSRPGLGDVTRAEVHRLAVFQGVERLERLEAERKKR